MGLSLYPGLQVHVVAFSESHSAVTEFSPHTRPVAADVMHCPIYINNYYYTTVTQAMCK